jgi:four helix bundle protein
MSLIKSYRELDVYKNAMELTMKIFELTKAFPPEERYNLSDQVRRSSRSVCTNLAEAWRKRRYRAAFIAKLSDSETEAAETQVSAEIALRCRYWNQETFDQIDQGYEKVLGQIVRMSDQADKWLIRPKGDAHG